jgi:hypothetical protein
MEEHMLSPAKSLKMYKLLTITLAVFLMACQNDPVQTQTTVEIKDTVEEEEPPPPPPPDSIHTIPSETKMYSNDRFRNVVVEKTGDHKFLVKGEARVFEAAFSWVIEDGHEELKKGFQMTSAGAPEWGEFRFMVDAQKKKPNSTLHLIIFEASPKDGSRQFQMPILLY